MEKLIEKIEGVYSKQSNSRAVVAVAIVAAVAFIASEGVNIQFLVGG
jgi:hypothetical protein